MKRGRLFKHFCCNHSPSVITINCIETFKSMFLKVCAMSRNLNHAIDETGNNVHIDSLNPDDFKSSGKLFHFKFFCPKCKQEVIPRFGHEKIWHFAHKERECFEDSIEYQKKSHHNFAEFAEKTVSVDEFVKQHDTDFFMCPICKRELKKEKGQKLSDFTYVCKSCYAQTPSSVLSKFF